MGSRILIATGGTGGHVYPAVALAQQLLREIPQCEVLFVGGSLDKNRFFDRAFDFRTVPCGAFMSRSFKSILSTLYNIGSGVMHSRKIIREFHPDVAVGFGSFYAFPPLVAAKIMGVPLILHEANSIPGKANRWLARWAEVTGVHFPETARMLNGNAVEVGMPLRDGFKKVEGGGPAAKLHYGLRVDLPTVLIFGGSQGAQVINSVVDDALGKPGIGGKCQVLHLTGNEQIVEPLQKRYKQANIHACVKAFETDMQLAWQAADLMIGRSGAGTIAEQLEFEVPGILIPYAKAAENHQESNANFMVATVGGAVKLQEKGLEGDRLVECLRGLTQDNGALVKAMRHAIRAYKKRVRTRDLCSLVKDYCRV